MKLIEKYLLAMQCLNAAIALAPTDPKVHERIVQFRYTVSPKLATLPPATSEVLKKEFPTVAESLSELQEFNDAFFVENSDSPRCVLAAARGRRMMGGKGCEEKLAGVAGMEGLELGVAVEVLETLRGWGGGEAERFREGVRARWPEASAFA